MEKRVICAELGWCVGRLVVDQQGMLESLRIISPSDSSDGYSPSESIHIYGHENIAKLKALLATVEA